MKKLLAAFLLFVASAAMGGSATVSWRLATNYTDGTPIAATGPTALGWTRIEYGPCAGPVLGTDTFNVIVPYPEVSLQLTNLPVGTTCFQAWTQLANGAESIDHSNVATKVVASPSVQPAPPAGLVAAAGTAYTILKQVDRFVMLPVGTVPASTPCDGTQTINGYFVVPRAAVTWAGDVHPDVVVAKCS